MPTSLPNSKKCSTRKTLVFALFSTILSASTLHASIPTAPIESELRRDLKQLKGIEFSRLTSQWERKHGSKAALALIKIARDKNVSDSSRYIALLSAAKMGGTGVQPELKGFLKDSLWLMRVGAIRSLSVTSPLGSEKWLLPLLKDPALLVRTEAIAAIEHLKPIGASAALISALQDSSNYNREGRAQLVPAKALSALRVVGDASIAGELLPLLSHHRDPLLQDQTAKTLEALTGKKAAPKLARSQLATEWKRLLTAR
jgi:hypothetical protein